MTDETPATARGLRIHAGGANKGALPRTVCAASSAPQTMSPMAISPGNQAAPNFWPGMAG
jgi:hypothetical protein